MGKSKKRNLVQSCLLGICAIVSVNLFAQETTPNPPIVSPLADDADLFTTGDNDITTTVVTAPNPNDIANKRPLTFSADFSASGGLSTGWTGWDKASSGFETLDASGGAIISTTLSFKAHFSREFSFQGGVTAVYPPSAVSNPTGEIFVTPKNAPASVNIGLFAVTTGDIFADYSIADMVFIKVGKFVQTWGNSYFFKAADAINRYVLTKSDNNDGIRLKITVPIGPVNISLLGQAFNGYFSDISSINVKNVGYAAYVDMPIGPVEIGLGYFYQRALTPRLSMTLKSSISPIDFFVDASLAFDYSRLDATQTNTTYFSVSAGMYGDVKEIVSQFYLEYLYNGERSYDLASKTWKNSLSDSYQPGGHNLSLLWRLKLDGRMVVQPLAQFGFNFSDGSVVIIPGVTINITDNLKLQLGLPIYLDSKLGTTPSAPITGEAAYLSSNVIQGHVVGLVIRLTLSGAATTE